MAGPGVALGTALAEGLGALFAASQLRPALKRWPGSMPWRGLRRATALFSGEWGSFLRTLTLLLCLSVFTAQGAGLGTAIVAANALLINLFMAVSASMASLTPARLQGQALGRRDLKEARAWVWLALKLAFVGAVVSTAIFWAFGPELIALLTDIDHVATTGEAALPGLIAFPLPGRRSLCF